MSAEGKPVVLGRSGGITARACLVDGARGPLLYVYRGGAVVLLGGKEIDRLRKLTRRRTGSGT